MKTIILNRQKVNLKLKRRLYKWQRVIAPTTENVWGYVLAIGDRELQLIVHKCIIIYGY